MSTELYGYSHATGHEIGKYKNKHFVVFNKVIYSVLTQHRYIIINTLVLATRFGFYQPSSGLCLLHGGYIQCAHTLWGQTVFT